MGKKKKSKRKNRSGDNGGMTVPAFYASTVEKELRGLGRRPQTIRAIRRAVERFESWSLTQKKPPLTLANVKRKDLMEFRDWIASTGAKVTAQNSSVRSVIQILRSAVKHELIPTSPVLEPLPVRKSAPKVLPTDTQISSLWDACDGALWPDKDSRLNPLPYPAATGLRAALVLYRSYGMRTQELVRLERNFRSLTWSCVHPPGLTPNPEGVMECEHGWIAYVPQKQERHKWQPLVIPLNAITRAAIDSVRPPDAPPDKPVFDWAMSSVGFYGAWRSIFAKAGVRPREASGVEYFTLKHLRKAAYTAIDSHRPGVAEHIVGHCGDRSQTTSIVGKTHYFNAEAAVLECVQTMPLPEAFGKLLTG